MQLDYGKVLDTRDLIARITYLETDEETLGEDEQEELAELREAESIGIPDWQYGETLIREDYFEEYARELAEDIGAIDPAAVWPLTYIDWEAAADALKQDYVDVTLNGFVYYARA